MSVTYSRSAVFESTPTRAKPFLVYCAFDVTWNRPHRRPVKFTVKEGFDTDLASIPWGARNLISQFAGAQQAAAHDYSYQGHTKLTKDEADQLFFEGLRTPGSGVRHWKAWLMYQAVRLGGKGHWG